MKIKAVLMDLGKTIIDNAYFNFSCGLKAVYDKLKVKKVCYDVYLEESLLLKKKSYDLRDENNIEIKIVDYLNVLNEKFDVEFSLSNEEIEDVFLDNSCVDYPYDNVIDFLKLLKEKNVPVIIVSNSTFSSRALKKEIQRFDLLNYVDELISSADFGLRKPSEAFFNYGFSLLKDKNITKEETVYIGNDYKLDIIGSFGASLNPIWYNHKCDIDYGAFALFDYYNYQDLIEKIEKYL